MTENTRPDTHDEDPEAETKNFVRQLFANDTEQD